MVKKVQQLQPLPHYLPFQFKNGVIIRQFSKPCLRCNEILHAQHMYGLIRPIDEYAALAAQAKCPVCGLQFNIACLINDRKQVRRVLLPALFFRWYLQVLPYTARMPAPTQKIQADTKPFIATPSSPLPSELTMGDALTPPPTFEFERSEEAVGQYNGKPIPAYIIIDNYSLPFNRVATANPQLAAGEYLIDDHLIYSKSSS